MNGRGRTTKRNPPLAGRGDWKIFSKKMKNSATIYAYEKNAPKGTIRINNKVEGISC